MSGWGDKRDGVAPLALAQEMHRLLAGSRMSTYPGGHLFFLRRGEGVCEEVLAFTASLASGS